MTTPYERTLAIMADREIPLAELARHLNIDRSAVSRAFKASKGLERHWSEVAVFLRVSADWLLYGTGPMETRERESGLHRVAENIAHYMTDGASLSYAGQVTAGGGFVSESQDPDDWCPVALRPGWKLVRIEGDSAVPVVWPGQSVIVDTDGARTPPKHNRIVVVQTKDGRAYCKRWCVAGDGHVVLASLNGGADSIALHEDDVSSVSVVVGTLFTDSVAR